MSKDPIAHLEATHGIKVLCLIPNDNCCCFIYVRRHLTSYITLQPPDDLIDGSQSYIGYDIMKVYKYILQSNPTSMEWIQSIIQGRATVYDPKNIGILVNLGLKCLQPDVIQRNWVARLKAAMTDRISSIHQAKPDLEVCYLYPLQMALNLMYYTTTSKYPPLDRMTLFTQCKDLEIVAPEVCEYGIMCLDIMKTGLLESEPMPILDAYLEAFKPTVSIMESQAVDVSAESNAAMYATLREYAE